MLNAVETRAGVQHIVSDDVVIAVCEETGTVSGEVDAFEEGVRL